MKTTGMMLVGRASVVLMLAGVAAVASTGTACTLGCIDPDPDCHGAYDHETCGCLSSWRPGGGSDPSGSSDQCASDGDCDDHARCSGARCVACIDDGDCRRGAGCHDNRCVQICDALLPCPLGSVCAGASGTCVVAGLTCNSSKRCPRGMVCDALEDCVVVCGGQLCQADETCVPRDHGAVDVAEAGYGEDGGESDALEPRCIPTSNRDCVRDEDCRKELGGRCLGQVCVSGSTVPVFEPDAAPSLDAASADVTDARGLDTGAPDAGTFDAADAASH